MRNLKKVLSLTLALVMMLGMMVVGAGAVETSFKDDSSIGEDYKEAVAVMNALGIIEGKDDGNFDPKGTLTRGQAAKIVCYMVLGKTAADKLGEITDSAVFADVNGHWAAGYIEACSSMGIVDGVGDNKFDPEGTLTGTAFAKMVLTALEIEGVFTGPEWEKNVRLAAIKAGLTNVSSGSISREAAAKMSLEGLDYSADGGKTVYTVTKSDGTVAYSGSDSTMATFALVSNAGSKVSETTTKPDSLGYKNYGLEKSTTEKDAFGRTTTVWTAKGGVKVEIATTEAAFVFNTAMTEAQIYTEIGATGIKGSSARYIVMDEIYINGKLEGKSEQIGTTGQYQNKADIDDETADNQPGSAANSVIIAQGDKSNAAGFGNGVTVEIYATSTPNHYKMVAYNEYVATVTGVKKANSTTGTPRSITVTVDKSSTAGIENSVYTLETEDFAKDDVVLITVSDGTIKTIKEAETVSGALTKIAGGKYTLGGSEYTMSQNFSGNRSLAVSAKEVTYYVDSSNNLIMAKDDSNPDSTGDYVFVLTNAAAASYLDTSTNKVTTVYESVAINEAGELITITVAKVDGSNAAASSPADDTLYQYTLDASGKYVLKTVSASASGSQVDDGDAGATLTGISITQGTGLIATNLYANASTKFYVAKQSGTNWGVTVYEGIRNMPSASGGTIIALDEDKNGVAEAVFVKGTSVGASVNYAYATGEQQTEIIDNVAKTTKKFIVEGKEEWLEVDTAVERGYLYAISGTTATKVNVADAKPSHDNVFIASGKEYSASVSGGLLTVTEYTGTGTDVVSRTRFDVANDVPVYDLNNGTCETTEAGELSGSLRGNLVVVAKNGTTVVGVYVVSDEVAVAKSGKDVQDDTTVAAGTGKTATVRVSGDKIYLHGADKATVPYNAAFELSNGATAKSYSAYTNETNNAPMTRGNLVEDSIIVVTAEDGSTHKYTVKMATDVEYTLSGQTTATNITDLTTSSGGKNTATVAVAVTEPSGATVTTDYTVTVSSSKENFATATFDATTGNITVTGVAVGTTTITVTVTPAGDNVVTHDAVEKTFNVTVTS